MRGRMMGGKAGDLHYGPNGGTFWMRRETLDVEVEGADWVCAIALPQKAFVVADDLRAMGFRALAPHGVRVCKRARVPGGPKRGTVATRDYPALGPYVLVGQPAGFRLTKRTHRMMAGMVSVDGAPLRIPRPLVKAALDDWREGRWDERAAPSVRAGETARIAKGPFAGFSAWVERLRDDGLADVLIRLFGAMRSVPIDAGALEVI